MINIISSGTCHIDVMPVSEFEYKEPKLSKYKLCALQTVPAVQFSFIRKKSALSAHVPLHMHLLLLHLIT